MIFLNKFKTKFINIFFGLILLSGFSVQAELPFERLSSELKEIDLSLTNSNILTDSDIFELVALCPNLEKIDLSDQMSVTFTGVSHLMSNLPIRIANFSRMDLKVFIPESRMLGNELEYIDLTGNSPGEMKNLFNKGLPKLKTLVYSHPYINKREYAWRPVGLQKVAKHEEGYYYIEDIFTDYMTDQDLLDFLVIFPQLEKITLDKQVEITDDGLRDFIQQSKVDSLKLEYHFNKGFFLLGINKEGNGLKSLEVTIDKDTFFPNLLGQHKNSMRFLSLKGTGSDISTEQIMKCLQELPNLESLSIQLDSGKDLDFQKLQNELSRHKKIKKLQFAVKSIESSLISIVEIIPSHVEISLEILSEINWAKTRNDSKAKDILKTLSILCKYNTSLKDILSKVYMELSDATVQEVKELMSLYLTGLTVHSTVDLEVELAELINKCPNLSSLSIKPLFTFNFSEWGESYGMGGWRTYLKRTVAPKDFSISAAFFNNLIINTSLNELTIDKGENIDLESIATAIDKLSNLKKMNLVNANLQMEEIREFRGNFPQIVFKNFRGGYNNITVVKSLMWENEIKEFKNPDGKCREHQTTLTDIEGSIWKGFIINPRTF